MKTFKLKPKLRKAVKRYKKQRNFNSDLVVARILQSSSDTKAALKAIRAVAESRKS